MKYNKRFFVSAVTLLSVFSLVACTKDPKMNDWRYDPEKIYEVGDTVKEWKSDMDYLTVPLDIPEGGSGTREIVKNLGNEDKISLHYKVKSNEGYITSELKEDPFFNDLDAKNGDIISLFVYVPSTSNLASLELEVNSVTYGGGYGSNPSFDTFKSEKLEVTSDKEERWIRLMVSYDTLYVLRDIRLNFVPVDNTKEVEFYVDDINITYGSETVETAYESNNESLAKAYKDYFIVGTELSANMVKNSKYREITKDNFVSVTAENEGKPERVLDQAACQELAKQDETQVAIRTTEFEKIYDWCEANHIRVRHHTFVWHQQTPSWFFKQGYSDSGANVSRQTMLYRLENYFRVTIQTLHERWPGLVYALDVVNEAIEEVGQIRNGNWRNIVGDDFIYQAFLLASRHKRDYQELYYNDYAFDQMKWGGVDRCHWAVDTLLKQAIDEGLVDGIGLQSHIEEPAYSDAVIEDAKIIHAAGIKCQITELDVDRTNSNGVTEEGQKDLYKKIVKSVLEGNANGTMSVNAIVVWGISDNLSWHSDRKPLLFNSDYSKKPAYYGFLEALNEFEGKNI